VFLQKGHRGVQFGLGRGLTPTAAPAGIRTVLKQANSGSLAVLDGYQSSTSSSYFLKWG